MSFSHKMETRKSLLKQAIQCLAEIFSPPPDSKIPWGLSGAIEIMMESRQEVNRKIEQREQWEKRYAQIQSQGRGPWTR